MAEQPPAEPDALAHRLAVSSAWANRIALSVVLVVVAVGAALLAAPGLSRQKIPELKQDDVGKVFRATGMSGFKASRDYQILDEEKTGVQREEVRAHVRPVFDYDPSVQPQVARGVEEGFAQMQ